MDGVHERTLLIFSDKKGYEKLVDNPFGVRVAMVSGNTTQERADTQYGQLGYWRLTSLRVHALVAMIQEGIPCLLFEPDALWVSNPLQDPCLWTAEHDLVAFVDGANIGFGWLLMEPTPATKRILNKMLARYDQQLVPYASDDSRSIAEIAGEQKIFQLMLLGEENATVRIQWLSQTKYVSGLWYLNETYRRECRREGVPYVLNNNWARGNAVKIQRAQKWGHWFLQDSRRGTCDNHTALQAATALMHHTMQTLQPLPPKPGKPAPAPLPLITVWLLSAAALCAVSGAVLFKRLRRRLVKAG